MSEQPRHGEVAAVEPTSSASGEPPPRRIVFDLLDSYSIDAQSRGYDPYNCSAGSPRKADLWKDKPKRS